MKVVSEIGSCWLPEKFPLVDAIQAALDCGADLAKVQFWTDGNMLAMRRGGVKGLEQWQIKPKDLLAMAEDLAEEHGHPVLGFSVFHPRDVQRLYDAQFNTRRMPFAFIKTASQEYQYAALAEAVSEFSASQRVPLMASVPPDGCLTMGNYHSPLPMTWMQCVPQYPADPLSYSINRQVEMALRLPGKLGVSDHTVGFELLASQPKRITQTDGGVIRDVREGCCVVEKHFIYHEALRGQVPDGGPWSLSQEDFKRYAAVAHGE